MNSQTAHILVTCTKRKRREAPPRLRLGTVRCGRPDDVARQWVNRLQDTKTTPVLATSLYAGDHWQIAASLPTSAATCGVKADLWVVSAGYGLIPSSAMIAPYSATFSSGHPDQVVARFHQREGADVLREWWEALSRWPGPVANKPRTIAALAALTPAVPIIVVASPKYLIAIQDDLVAARTALAEPGLLIVVSAGARGKGPLAMNMLDCSSRFQASLGGALMSLNVRVARSVLEKRPPYPWTVQGFRHVLENLPMTAPTGDKSHRRAVTDDDVRQYVSKAIHENPRVRHTTLLRRYRESGYACEQKRFGRLFKEVEQKHARTR